MQLGSQLGELTYCTNIHPGDTWTDVLTQLQNTAPGVKLAVSPQHRLGLGLQLSAQMAEQLIAPAALASFQSFLAAEDLYVFTVTGTSHDLASKSAAYEPDWRSEARLRYTNQLAELLAALLPTDGTRGSITTLGGGLKAPLHDVPNAAELLRDRLVRHAAYLYRLEEHGGQVIALALKPEPCCYLESTSDTLRFFKEWLFADRSVVQFAGLTGASRGFSVDLLRRYLGVCLDACHAAVEFESPTALVGQLREAGIDIKKLQLSAALRIPQLGAQHLPALGAYHNPHSLQQVVSQRANSLRHYQDLDEAIAELQSRDAGPNEEWRVRYQVPIFLQHLQDFDSTQDFLVTLLQQHQTAALSEHLEVATPTWPLLPAHLQSAIEDESIIRELQWVKDTLHND